MNSMHKLYIQIDNKVILNSIIKILTSAIKKSHF